MSAPTRQEVPHLFAGIIALGLAAIIFFAAQRVLIHLEHVSIVSTAPERFALKNQGLAFQRAAAHSAERIDALWQFGIIGARGTGTGDHFLPHRANRFPAFRLSAAEVQNPLTMLQRVGALGSALRGKRVAFSLSPGWFCTAKPGTQGTKGLFRQWRRPRWCLALRWILN